MGPFGANLFERAPLGVYQPLANLLFRSAVMASALSSTSAALEPVETQLVDAAQSGENVFRDFVLLCDFLELRERCVCHADSRRDLLFAQLLALLETQRCTTALSVKLGTLSVKLGIINVPSTTQ